MSDERLLRIKRIVEEVFGIEDISFDLRERKEVNARSSFCYHAYTKTGLTYGIIGRTVKRTHASVMHSVEYYPIYYKFDGYSDLHDEVTKRLENGVFKKKHDPIEWRDRYIVRLKKLIRNRCA